MIYKKVHGLKHEGTGIILRRIGVNSLMQNDLETALNYYKRSLEIFEDVHGKDDTNTALMYSEIGSLYLMECDHDKSLQYLESALEIEKK
jgi:tetratricopeptide (TPR) repeat protein